MIAPIRLDEIERASEIISAEAIRTPAVSSDQLDQLVGARLACKAESLQRTGSFKFRGAFHRLSLIAPADRPRGVVAVSSGNHGAAISCSAQLLGMSATVFVPEDIPEAKRSLIASFGAEIRTFERSIEDREAPARALTAATGATFVPPFEDRRVMIGQGTAAFELHQQVAERGAPLDALLVPMSGGGLMAGCGSATRVMAPNCRLVGVEPAAADDTARSFRAGSRVRIEQPVTIADGLAITTPGEQTFELNHQMVNEVLTVSEDEIVNAMRVIRDTLDLRVEPSGAVALAAVLNDPARWTGMNIGVIISGGNVDQQVYDRLIATQSGS